MYKKKSDQRKYAREHYLKNKSLYVSRARKFSILAREKQKIYIKEYLSTHPCTDCGESDIIVLEFDHVHGIKKNNIGNMVGGCSLNTLKKEIDKCEVRCANCHRRVTHIRRIQ